MATKLRIEVLLTDADDDIIEFVLANDTPRSAQFKNAMRSYMKRQTEEQVDVRVKRLIKELLAEQGGLQTIKTSEVVPKKKLGFGAQRG